ncbi:MAG TPA: phospholipase D-like domain-containing protein [Vicinamibacterales bacterium]|nr:phospholipase D-like domain-containing protein [Vicinamibacterales bacterium]
MLYLTIIGGVFICWLVLVALFTPHIPYHIERELDAASDHFIRVLESTCMVTLASGNRIEILTNGDRFYPAMLEAIRSARETINMECYIFKKGHIGDQFVAALAERAQAGVRVTLVMDAIGSFGAFRKSAGPLRKAGCRVEPYQRITWYRLSRLNNRTHRELLVVDGHVAFIGGAGVADWWAEPTKGKPQWRDMMARVEGPVVSQIQGVAAENWVECCGEILTAADTYKVHPKTDGVSAFTLKSSPADRATGSRVLFQALVESAQSRLQISTPYFLPDKALREALIRTARRGVNISVVVPGAGTDQRWVRLASRRMFGQLLEAGIRIHEYEPGMLHVKMLIVDGLWSAIGTTNLDNRSFEHNDEVNLTVRDEAIAARLAADNDADIARSREITLDSWRRRPVMEKLVGSVAWVLERQQ